MMKKFLLGWADFMLENLIKWGNMFYMGLFAGAGFTFGALIVLCIARIIVG